MKPLLTFISAVMFFCALCSSAVAAPEDEWMAPRSGESGKKWIKKWCEVNGKKVRYSDKEVPGYAPCGDVDTTAYCDPSGKRFISIGGSKPSGAYRDCALGKRIYVEREDGTTYDDIRFREAEKIKAVIDAKEGMSDTEKKEMRGKIDQIQKERKSDPEAQFQAAIEQMLKSYKIDDKAIAEMMKMGTGALK